jgi:hypothetical protein
MTIERILAHSSAGPLLGGLSWRPPAGGRHTMRRLHEARNLTTDATHYTLLSTDRTVVYGLFQPRASEESIRLAKGAQAAAHCFAVQVGAEAPNAALLLTVPADGQRKDERVYVVVLEDGVPVVDSLTTEMEARNALGSEDRPIWSDTPALYPNCQAVDFEWLARGATKATRMAQIPLNPWPLLMVLVMVGAGFATWFSVREARRAEAAREQARLAAENDPVPKYLAALAARSKDMAFDRQAWLGVVDGMFDRPAMVPGWRMKSTECNAVSLRCETVWARQGGTYDELKAAVPNETLGLQGVEASVVPALDLARTSTPWRIDRRSLGTPGERLPTFTEAIRTAGSLFQVWRTADLSIEIKAPRLWPRVEAVPAQFEHPQALMSGAITLSDVPGPFVLEALRTAPDWISWESVRADIGEGDVVSRLKFKATGVYYVSLR